MFEETTLSSLDITFFASSLAFTLLIGLYFANKNKTFADYARGGGKQNVWVVSASMAVSYCSALTLIGNPSELYMNGASYTLVMLTTFIAWPLSSFVFLPVFKRLDGISIFQYIEDRFSPFLRRVVSLLFTLLLLFYTSLSLYLPSLPLYTTLRIPQSVSVGLIGFICILYSSFGGIKAVTWSNLYHSILLVVSMFSILIAGTIQGGGLKRVLQVSYEHNRLSLGPHYFTLDLTTRHTIYNEIFSFTILRLFLQGTSQMQVQSSLSLPSLKQAQASQLIAGSLFFGIQTVASLVGLVLFVNYQDCDPYSSGQIGRQDELLMHYVSKNLASIPLIQGMFIAALFGSTLTAMSSFQNSVSAMVVDDFVKPLWLRWSHKKLDEKNSALFGKGAALVLGISCMLLTFEMDKLNGLLQAGNVIYAIIGVPILAAFILGTLTQFVNSKGMFLGILAAFLFGAYTFWAQVQLPPLEPLYPVSVANCSNMLNQTSIETFAPSKLSNKTINIIASNQETNEQLVLDQNLADGAKADPIGQQQFDIAQLSYMWIPFFSMLISVVVACVASLLTGGWSQRIDPKYLVNFHGSSRNK